MRIDIKLRIACSPFILVNIRLVSSRHAPRLRDYDYPCVARLTFFLHEGTHFLSARISIACGQIFFNLQKKMVSSTSPLANIFQFVIRVFLMSSV